MSEQVFKPGDRVVCIDNKKLIPSQPMPLKLGKVYTVSKMYTANNVMLEETGKVEAWRADRFRLLSHAPAPAYEGPGPGWREVSSDATAERLLVLHEVGKPTRVWAEEEPVPPLPTEPYTVIRVTWKSKYQQRTRPRHLTRMSEEWYEVAVAQPVFPDALLEQITGFEVLARPVGKVLAEDEDSYFDSDDIRAAEKKGFANGAKQVIDYFEAETRFKAWTTSAVVSQLKTVFLDV